MNTPEYERWQAMSVRRPDDVRSPDGGPIPLSWQMEKLSDHMGKLMNRRLPTDFPYEVDRGDVGDALGALAVGESLCRDIQLQQVARVREAIELGATWDQVGDALDVTADEARRRLRSWADGQRELWLGYEAEGKRPFGLDADEYAAIIALCGDDVEEDVSRG